MVIKLVKLLKVHFYFHVKKFYTKSCKHWNVTQLRDDFDITWANEKTVSYSNERLKCINDSDSITTDLNLKFLRSQKSIERSVLILRARCVDVWNSFPNESLFWKFSSRFTHYLASRSQSQLLFLLWAFFCCPERSLFTTQQSERKTRWM